MLTKEQENQEQVVEEPEVVEDIYTDDDFDTETDDNAGNEPDKNVKEKKAKTTTIAGIKTTYRYDDKGELIATPDVDITTLSEEKRAEYLKGVKALKPVVNEPRKNQMRNQEIKALSDATKAVTEIAEAMLKSSKKEVETTSGVKVSMKDFGFDNKEDFAEWIADNPEEYTAKILEIAQKNVQVKGTNGKEVQDIIAVNEMQNYGLTEAEVRSWGNTNLHENVPLSRVWVIYKKQFNVGKEPARTAPTLASLQKDGIRLIKPNSNSGNNPNPKKTPQESDVEKHKRILGIK